MLKRLVDNGVNYRECCIQPSDVEKSCPFKDTPVDMLTLICQRVFLDFSLDKPQMQNFSVRGFSNLTLVCQKFYYLSCQVFKDEFPFLTCKESCLIKICRFGHAHLLQYLLTNPKLLPSKGCLTQIVDDMTLSKNIKHAPVLKILLMKFAITINNFQLALMAERNSIETIKILLEEEKINSGNAKNIFTIAFAYGRKDVVDILFEKGFDTFPDYPLNLACQSNNVELIELLLKRFDPNEHNVDHIPAICVASSRGHVEVVTLLLKDKRVDPTIKNNMAIRWSAEKGHTKIVKLLLNDPRIDPSDRNNYALEMATLNGHLGVVKLLLKDKRISTRGALELALNLRKTKAVKVLLKGFFIARVFNTAIKLSLVVTWIFLISKFYKN